MSAACGWRPSARSWPRSHSEKLLSNRPKESSMLAEFSRNLTQEALDGNLDPLIGRGTELERIARILCRRTKNNPVLIGEPGVGKTRPLSRVSRSVSPMGTFPRFWPISGYWRSTFR